MNLDFLKFWKPRNPQQSEPPSETSVSDTAAHLYIADQPIQNPDEDRFDRWSFARRIAETIARREDPSSIVFGLYGPWGDGKTSVLHLIEHALGDSPRILPVRFNPWLYRSQEILLKSFFAELARTVDKSPLSNKQRLGEAIKKLGHVVSLASISTSMGVIDPGKAIERLGETMSQSNLEEYRDRVQRLLAEAKARVVVFVDDIDRLDREEIHAILKMVKLSAAIEHVTYILAFDDRHVAEALSQMYGSGDARSGQNFLEKIVQVALFLPPVDTTDLRQFAFEGINEALHISEQELTKEEQGVFVNLFMQGLEPGLTTPRHAVRYSNNLIYALPALAQETNLVDLLLIEGIRSFYPELYLAIRDNLELLLSQPSQYEQSGERQKQIDAVIKSATMGRSDRDVRWIRKLVEHLFPRAGTSGYGSDWEKPWARQKRICSEQYSQRYFTYSVSRRDVSDALIDEFLRTLQGKPQDVADRDWATLVSRESAAQVMKKLRFREDEISTHILGDLARTVARHGGYYPHEEGLFSGFAATDAQAAILISKLIRRIEPMLERETAAGLIVEQAAPLSFAAMLCQWLRTGKDESEDKRILTTDGIKRIGKTLSTRVRNKAKDAWFPGDLPEASSLLFWIWHEYSGVPQEVAEYLSRNFNQDTRRVSEFLRTYVGKAYGMESGLPTRSEFDEGSYEAVARLVEPQIVYDHLYRIYGSLLDTDNYYVSSDSPLDQAIAIQFAIIHRRKSGTEPRAEDNSAPNASGS